MPFAVSQTTETSFYPVWLSSMEQMLAFDELYQSASAWEKVITRLSPDPAVPQIRGRFFPWMRVPVVLSAEGTLHVKPGEIRFSAREKKLLGWRVLNVSSDCELTLRPDEIVSIEACDWESPAIAYYSMPFTRVKTTQSGFSQDFLICVGALFPLMGRARRESQRLRDTLHVWAGQLD